ncbi:hypothetical protein MPK66_gp271 [Erwinia phage pEa_SNUABM_2]|uniref:Uncharacterized protein n=1 Tax=Erwinia phage pEa_SNUABM_2 TaxID=2869547 RepID=A0AAE8C1B3_9CAUD|nr:hypothetical protein MPK66_gp271 [Erwinia phage pEa_SNUABM_2]QZE59515.1 hypothetical protein pEaSNUABM2_00271 [Erwinia phage pEa_SNUABM_2]QZE59852.1 hypothetical protein pEaSNUABM39_00272 [Erwinia phage pEa_SNUABM_39]
MNKTVGLMIDEDVMNWLDMLMPHELRRVIDALNNIVYARRQELTVERLTEDEDVGALSHKELEIILRHASPKHEYDTSVLSNEQLLRLAIDAQSIIQYTLPCHCSPIMVKRAFANGLTCSLLGSFSNRADIIMAVHHWEYGLSNISLDSITDSDARPDEQGLYLCYDEHKQIRYGRLFKNANEGWTFHESYSNGGSTSWLEAAEGKALDDDDLPICLLSNWVFVAPDQSPSIIRKETDIKRLSDTQRIFLYLRSLSPHVKAEIVTHFDGVLDNRVFTSVDQIGRLTETDWRNAAIAIGEEERGQEGKHYWDDRSAWACFVAVLNSLCYDMETRDFQPQYEYQANDDTMEEDNNG